MGEPVNPVEALRQLEAQHDELFRVLQDLERRVATVLAQYLPGRCEDSQDTSGPRLSASTE